MVGNNWGRRIGGEKGGVVQLLYRYLTLLVKHCITDTIVCNRFGPSCSRAEFGPVWYSRALSQALDMDM